MADRRRRGIDRYRVFDAEQSIVEVEVEVEGVSQHVFLASSVIEMLYHVRPARIARCELFFAFVSPDESRSFRHETVKPRYTPVVCGQCVLLACKEFNGSGYSAKAALGPKLNDIARSRAPVSTKMPRLLLLLKRPTPSCAHLNAPLYPEDFRSIEITPLNNHPNLSDRDRERERESRLLQKNVKPLVILDTGSDTAFLPVERTGAKTYVVVSYHCDDESGRRMNLPFLKKNSVRHGARLEIPRAARL